MDERLKALYTRYRDALPERLGRLDGLLAEARSGNEDSLRAFVADLHKLAGTAGSFGEPALGEAARAFEIELMAAWFDRDDPRKVIAQAADELERRI